MKCRRCGAELAEGVLFCRECGAKVEKRKRFCSECGSELPEGVKFCPECGTKVSFAGNAEAGTPTQTSGEYQTEKSTAGGKRPETEIHLHDVESKEDTDFQSLGDKIKAKAVSRWDSFDLFCKAAAVGMGIALLLFLTAMFSHRGLPIFISVLQVAGVAAAVLMHKGIIKSPKDWLKYVVLAAAFLFTVLNLMSYQTGRSGPEAEISDQTPQAELSAEQKMSETAETPSAVQTDYRITKGSQYAFMSDEWNVYIASAISDSIIKIEHWNKGSSTTKKMSYSKDIGSYKINDPENGFAWLDDERTAFTFIFQDKGNSRVKKAAAHVFTVNVSDSDICKGTDYDERIACYSYTNDDWHMYRAIPLSEHLIKIECWSRSSSTGKFLFGWDWCVISTDHSDTDFEWTDEERTSFTLTTKDPENGSHWKEEKFVVFELENPGYKYPDVTTCLGLQIVGDDEAKAPDAASDYKHDDYKEVENRLSGAGFTNIRTEILYDIVLGWTSEGEVESVSINGDTSFDKGAVFKKNAEIIITYHMKEEDNPSKKTAESDNAETVKTEEKDPGTGAAEAEAETSKAEKEHALYYSTNGRDKAKEGNAGVYAYRNRGGQYYNYYVIDFDEGFVYFFTEGNGDESCERLRIQEGDLNEGVKVTYHDHGDTWDNYLHFKWKRQPNHLILVDHNFFEWDYYAVDLNEALEIKARKRISDY